MSRRGMVARETWRYGPDYASPERPPALVYAKADGVEVWRLAITAG